MRLWGRRIKTPVEFDEVLLDASNLPAFDRERMEGKIELPITARNIYVVGILFLVIALGFVGKIFSLQVIHGAELFDISQSNTVERAVIIAERGVIYDRNGEMLAWNEFDYNEEYDFPIRAYTDRQGLGQLIGYVSYPQKDSSGFFFRTDYLGRTGVEETFDSTLRGENGRQVIEEDALGEIIGEHVIESPIPGSSITLSVDAELSEAMFNIIATSTKKAGFRSGAGAIMDVHTGEIIALASFPSYDPEVMADGDDVALIESYNNDDRFPFLNKIVGGAYVPGSIVKPFIAYAALVENIVTPNTTMFSNGRLVIPNPYHPDKPTIFRDWRAHGSMTIREAIAFSSDVYLYVIGGGLPKIAVPQAGITEPFTGLGITKLAAYMRKFGFGEKTGIELSSEQAGTVPDPAWKLEQFDEEWLLGNTYHTSIGQYGFLVTPLQMLRGYAALANGGTMVTPHVIKGEFGEKVDLELNPVHLRVVQEGMLMAVNYDGGTARPLERQDVAVAAKSGTAELGHDNAHVNSWIAGYFPYEDPQYSFILMLERAPRDNTLSATRVFNSVVDWMSEHRREYLSLDEVTEGETSE